MSTLYSTRVTAIGGRSGTVRSEDGVLDLPLALPTTMGGKGGATNPEQLFAAGYAACFENAVIHVTRNKATKVKLCIPGHGWVGNDIEQIDVNVMQAKPRDKPKKMEKK